MYTNDTSAPRMRKAKFSKQIITRELWQKFKKTYPEYKWMKWLEFKGFWADITQTIREEAITNPLGVKLGSYTGELKLQYLWNGFKGKNHKLSNEMGEEINHLNLMSKGKVATIKWERRWAVKFNRILQFFAFTATREMNKLADKHTASKPELLRETRNTTGGFSIWRQLKNRK